MLVSLYPYAWELRRVMDKVGERRQDAHYALHFKERMAGLSSLEEAT